jgi:molybdopterin synthase catalytic subunit
MSFSITRAELDTDRLRRAVRAADSGACVVFEGWVRNHNEGREVLRLEYEVYEPLAVKEGRRILAEAGSRFGPLRAACVHRSGMLELEELAVVVAVSAAHREEAFQACRYIIDAVKLRLPIWKKEHYAEGDSHWVNCQRCANPATARERDRVGA